MDKLTLEYARSNVLPNMEMACLGELGLNSILRGNNYLALGFFCDLILLFQDEEVFLKYRKYLHMAANNLGWICRNISDKEPLYVSGQKVIVDPEMNLFGRLLSNSDLDNILKSSFYFSSLYLAGHAYSLLAYYGKAVSYLSLSKNLAITNNEWHFIPVIIAELVHSHVEAGSFFEAANEIEVLLNPEIDISEKQTSLESFSIPKPKSYNVA